MEEEREIFTWYEADDPRSNVVYRHWSDREDDDGNWYPVDKAELKRGTRVYLRDALGNATDECFFIE